MIFNFSGRIHKTRGTIWKLFHSHQCLLNSPLYRVLQLSVGRSGVVLLLVLAIFCCQFPDTTCSRSPKHMLFYIWCIDPCAKKLKSCFEQCQENNTCEASRNFCKDLCWRAEHICEKRCRDEAERQRIMNNE